MTAVWDPPLAVPGQQVEDGPFRLRHELAWRVRLPAARGGGLAVVAQLVPELAADLALRRRWVHEATRLPAAAPPSLPETLAIGPAPDPSDPAAEAPWRLRTQPIGTTLEAMLGAGPLPIDRALELGARLADAVAAAHACGVVLRDLEPRAALFADDGRVWLVDVGQARLAILSSRTASSLMLESSPYAAPEALRSTTVDGRADIYSVAAMIWHALVGAAPRGTGMFGPVAASALDLDALRPGLPAGLGALLARCLEPEADLRPATARELASALRGEPVASALVVRRAECQACGQPMRVGLRLCLACGREAITLRHVDGDPEACTVTLLAAKEDEQFAGKLRGVLSGLATELPHLNFVIGDARMYDKDEKEARHPLPALLLTDVEPASAAMIGARLEAAGMKVKVERVKPPVDRVRAARTSTRRFRAAAGSAVLGVGLAVVGFGVAAVPLIGFGAIAAVFGGVARRRSRTVPTPPKPLLRLRAAASALPASDPLVAQLAALLTTGDGHPPLAPDLRMRIEEVAVGVQRWVDAQAGLTADGRRAVAGLTEPIAPLVSLVVATATQIAELDRELATLDEGTLVRALAASVACRQPASARAELLTGLDRLRALEDQRAALIGRLLEAATLLGRVIELGLARAGTEAIADVELRLATLALDKG